VLKEKRGALNKRGSIWRSFFDPLYMPRWAFIEPVIVGVLFAIILGIARGWEGAVGGGGIGLLFAGLYGGRYLLVRYLTKKKRRQD
jgi:hypothetical protein